MKQYLAVSSGGGCIADSRKKKVENKLNLWKRKKNVYKIRYIVGHSLCRRYVRVITLLQEKTDMIESS